MTETIGIKKLLMTLTAAAAAILFILLTPARAYAADSVSPTVTVSSSKANQIVVSWTSVSGASSYNVYRCDKTSAYTKIVSTSATSYTDTTVANDKPYEYSVTATVNGKETAFNNKGAVGYTAYKAPHVYGWTVTDLTPWTFTVSGKVSYAGTASTLMLPVWTETNGQDDLRWYSVPITNNTFSYTIYTSNHGSQRGVYVLDPYLNGTTTYCSAPLWVEVPTGPLMITAPEIANLSTSGFTATAQTKAFNNKVKNVTAEIWTAYKGEDDLETVTASYDSTTGVISCPVSIAKHNNEGRLYYVRFTVTDGAGAVKSLLLSAYVPTTQKCMSLTIIDLGDGNIAGSATLLTSKGKALLIDTGRTDSAEAVVACLRQHKVSSVDIIITHGDGDHVGVSQAIIDAGISIGNIYTDGYPSDVMWDELDRRASMTVFKKYGTIKPIPSSLQIGDATLQTIGPVKHYSLYDAKSNSMSQANANSYWFLITNGSKKVLINGDSELASSKAMLNSGKDISADIYVLGHHGAAGSLDASVLNAISPSMAVASGRITSAITSDTIKVLKNAGVPYYFTGAYGCIDISIRGVTMTVNTEKNTDASGVYYEVTWKNADGSVLERDTWVRKGASPSYDGKTPVKAADAQYTYTFAGWSTDGMTVLSSLPAVTADTTYIAVYNSTVNQYQITWKNVDNSVLKTEKLPYGSMPDFGSTPEYPYQDGLAHTFAGWTPELKKVTGAATYKASYLVDSPKVKRLSGKDRILTAQKILQEAFPDDSQDMLIVTGALSFQNQIEGIVLAGIHHCPLLITTASALYTSTAEEIDRMAREGCKVIILGDESEVSLDVEETLLGLNKIETVNRVAGETELPEEMSLEVFLTGTSNESWSEPRTVIVASGTSFADEMAIAPYAYAAGIPILLTNEAAELPEESLQELLAAGTERAILVGGAAVVSQETEARLQEAGVRCLRLAGRDRCRTAEAIFYWLLGEDQEAAFQPEVLFSPEAVGFATADDFPDAVTSANLLGLMKGPLLLVTDNSYTIQIMFECLEGREHEVVTAYIFGGTGVVSNDLACRIADAVTPKTE